MISDCFEGICKMILRWMGRLQKAFCYIFRQFEHFESTFLTFKHFIYSKKQLVKIKMLMSLRGNIRSNFLAFPSIPTSLVNSYFSNTSSSFIVVHICKYKYVSYRMDGTVRTYTYQVHKSLFISICLSTRRPTILSTGT